MFKNVKLKTFLALFFIGLNINPAFGLENEVDIPLPPNKSSVIWNKRNPAYNYEGSYSDDVGNQYSIKIYTSDPSIPKTEFFTNKLHELFGISTLPQRLVKASEVKEQYVSDYDVAIITKLRTNLKPLSSCSSEDIAKIQEPLARLHLISALTSHYFSIQDEKSCEIFVQDGKIYIVHSPGSLNHRQDSWGQLSQKDYLPIADDLIKLLEPQTSWDTAKLFQEPFKKHTQQDLQKFITWLDNSWDESKVDALFKASSLEDKQILINLKSRFLDLKKRLTEMQRDGHELYTAEKITKLIKENEAADKQPNKHIFKNIYYEFKEILPEIEEQMFICTDGNKVWFEFTNYEFLINGNKSNNMVKIYVGDVSSNNNLHATAKQSFEIFDSETTYVFMQAVLKFWDSNRDLAQALKAGYQAIFYHFGFPDSLEDQNADGMASSFNELVEFWRVLQEKYKTEAKRIERLVTIEDIEKNKQLGLNAYYPNPAYLGDIAIYKRPPGMSYPEYINTGKLKTYFMGQGLYCNKNYLTKSPDINFDYCDEYNKILEEIYPDDIIYLNNTNKFHFSDFKRIKNIYTFRGNNNSPDEVYATKGFWFTTSKYIGNSQVSYSIKDNKQTILEDRSFWEIPVSSGIFSSLHHSGRAYVSTSKLISVAQGYGKYVYVILVNGGLVLPEDFKGKKIYDFGLREIVVPGGVDWKNIIGVTEQSHNSYSIGPVYLKQSLAQEDPKNFWEILQIMGKKPQCSDSEFNSNIAKRCINLWDNKDENMLKDLAKILAEYYVNYIGLNGQELKDLLSLMEREPKGYINMCEETLVDAIGLAKKIPRT